MKQPRFLFWMLFQQALYQLAIVTLAAANTDKTHQLRDINGEAEDAEFTDRKLEWLIAGKTYKVIANDAWYSWYDKKEIPLDITARGDEKDKLRSTDVCPGTNNKYTRENCPAPPDCSQVKEKWGKGKLCLNRVPLPFNTDIFYVATMKCIPWWENCDKCVCGIIDYSTGLCKFKQNHRPDDDRQDVDCSDLSKVTFKSYYHISGEFEPFIPDETQHPSDSPSSSPSSTLSISPSDSPSSSPSETHSRIPSFTPTISLSSPPSISHSSSPSKSPSSSPSKSPSTSPSSSPSKSPSRSPSTSPSKSPSISPSKSPSVSPSSSPSTFPSSSPSFTPSLLKSPKINVSGSQTNNVVAASLGTLSFVAFITGGLIYNRKRKAVSKDLHMDAPPMIDDASVA